jgi:hypothetical protein
MGALCLLSAILSVGVSVNRLVFTSYGVEQINQLKINNITILGNDGIYIYDIPNSKDIRVIKYSYKSDNCYGSANIFVPPFNSCINIPLCTLCIDNYNYQRCDDDSRLYIDMAVFIIVISTIYMSLWIIVPLLTMFVSLIKPSGSHGLFKRYIIISSIISGGTIVKAQCIAQPPFSDPIPLQNLGHNNNRYTYQMDMIDTSECSSLIYTDSSGYNNLLRVCYSRYSYQSNYVPTYNFATSLSYTSSTGTDWTNNQAYSETLTYVPGVPLKLSPTGSVNIVYNDLCCTTNSFRNGLTCLDYNIDMSVGGVATMLVNSNFHSYAYVSITKTSLVLNRSSTSCYTLDNIQNSQLVVYDGISITLSINGIFADPEKTYDITESTMILDNFGLISGVNDMYIGDYPPTMSTPLTSTCESAQRPINRTVTLNSCNDFAAYGLINSQSVFSFVKNRMNFVYDTNTGIPAGSIVLRGLSGGWSNVAQASATQQDIEFASIANVISLVRSDLYISYLAQHAGDQLYKMLGGNTPLTDDPSQNYDGGLAMSCFSAIYTTKGCSAPIVYALNIIMGANVAKMGEYVAECSLRFSEYTQTIDYRLCLLRTLASSVCYGPTILYASTQILALCLYTINQIDFQTILDDMTNPFIGMPYPALSTVSLHVYWDPFVQVSINDYACNMPYATLACTNVDGQPGNNVLHTIIAAGTIMGSPVFYPRYYDYTTAGILLSAFIPLFKVNMQLYEEGRTMSCDGDVSSACSTVSIADGYTACLDTCYVGSAIAENKPPLPINQQSAMTDDTTVGCGLNPINVRALTSLSCSAYPEFRWPYTISGTPTLNGLIPPSIVSGTCIAPTSDGLTGDTSQGYIESIVWSGKLPPEGNNLQEIYASVSVVNTGGYVSVTEDEFYQSGTFISSPMLSAVFTTTYPVKEESTSYATYLDVIDITYVTGYVNNDVTFICNAIYESPGIIAILGTENGNSKTENQFCYISSNSNCSFFTQCNDSPCTVIFSASYTNTTINGQFSKSFIIPSECNDCNKGGPTTQNNYDDIGQGCFLFCWNFSGIGGFFGALFEWGIIIFIIMIGLTILCMLPSIIPKKHNN